MKGLKHLLAIITVSTGLASVANATVINISMNPNTGQPSSDVNKGYFGNNSPKTNFNGLLQQISLYNNFNGTNLPTPTFTGFFGGSSSTVNLTGFDYAVLHYGKGSGGSGQGGGIEFFFLNGMTGNYTFGAKGLGPNGKGGFSSIRLFSAGDNNGVPDGGATLAMLGIAMVGIGLLKKKFSAS